MAVNIQRACYAHYKGLDNRPQVYREATFVAPDYANAQADAPMGYVLLCLQCAKEWNQNIPEKERMPIIPLTPTPRFIN